LWNPYTPDARDIVQLYLETWVGLRKAKVGYASSRIDAISKRGRRGPEMEGNSFQVIYPLEKTRPTGASVIIRKGDIKDGITPLQSKKGWSQRKIRHSP